MSKASTKKVYRLADYSLAKIACYKKYLEIYLAVIANSPFKKIYLLDLFAGEGRDVDGKACSSIAAVEALKEMTWNPVTGCDKISAGCKYCYAEVMAKRLQAMGVEKYKDAFKLTLHDDALLIPYTWRKQKIVFVNSMSDLFHNDVPLEFILRVFKTMNENPQHTFQVLTKRAERLFELNAELKWTHNIWMGVSVENNKVKSRIDYLRQTSARTKFLSCEPLIGSLGQMNLENIDWVIVGGESGRKARPMKEDWVLNIMDQCKERNVAFFFKQWGGTNKKKTGRTLNGRTYDEMPFRVEEL